MRPTSGSDAAIVAQLRQGRPVVYRATGRSMRPSIPPGSLVSIAPDTHPRLGDVVLAAKAHSLVLHRVVCQGPHSVWLKGHRNRKLERVPRTAILGRAVASCPPGGSFSSRGLEGRRAARWGRAARALAWGAAGWCVGVVLHGLRAPARRPQDTCAAG